MFTTTIFHTVTVLCILFGCVNLFTDQSGQLNIYNVAAKQSLQWLAPTREYMNLGN